MSIVSKLGKTKFGKFSGSSTKYSPKSCIFKSHTASFHSYVRHNTWKEQKQSNYETLMKAKTNFSFLSRAEAHSHSFHSKFPMLPRRSYSTEENKKEAKKEVKKDASKEKKSAWTVQALQERLRKLPGVVKDELLHYWKGSKLLVKNMRVSFSLSMRILRGEKLTRSEGALLERTVADTFRLVPFVIIAVVPFLEFSLPFLLKIFPNMLPSTFTTKSQAEMKIQKQLQLRLSLARFQLISRLFA